MQREEALQPWLGLMEDHGCAKARAEEAGGCRVMGLQKGQLIGICDGLRRQDPSPLRLHITARM